MIIWKWYTYILAILLGWGICGVILVLAFYFTEQPDPFISGIWWGLWMSLVVNIGGHYYNHH